MWDKISNKILIPSILAFSTTILLTQGLSAFPKYTSRENAILLADVLDKGYFRGSQITSVFVKNYSGEQYFLQAILDDGSSRKWTLDSIYDWVKKDDLLLEGNRALIFPIHGSTEFGVLDKNEFYRTVLKARAFHKTFGPHDPLEGRSLLFSKRKFTILEEDGTLMRSFDKTGHRYRYVIELENGMREFLTYPQTYGLIQSKAFIRKPHSNAVVHKSPFQVREIKKIERRLEDELRQIWSFGIEIFFDRPITLDPSHFGYQIVEQYLKDPITGKRKNLFFIQIYIPNSLKNQQIPGFKNFEYLRFVEIISDVEHQRRVMLRAQINPNALELSPYVKISENNSIIVYFFTVTDQTVASPNAYVQSKEPLHPSRTLISMDGPKTPFEKEYMTAVELISEAQYQKDKHLKVENYLSALEALYNASLQAENDFQISQALKQRDILLTVLPKQVIENVQAILLSYKKSGKQLTEELRKQLARQLIEARPHTFKEVHQQKLDSLNNIINTNLIKLD